MGTRALIRILKDAQDSENLVTIYCHLDGYPEGLGKDIFKILNEGNTQIVNGITEGSRNPDQFNGMGDLAAYLIKKLKKDIGEIYIYPTSKKPTIEDYVYTLFQESSGLNITILEVATKKSYTGKLLDFHKLVAVLQRIN